MRPCHALLLLGLLFAACCQAATYTVTTLSDSGLGSLRAAIVLANATTTRDTITFDGSLAGGTISLVTPLPKITQLVVMDGDLNDDGVPDIRLRGALLAAGNGLEVERPSLLSAADAGVSAAPPTRPVGCTFIGLAITNFPGMGLRIVGGEGHRIYACHIGVGVLGNSPAANEGDGVSLEQTRYCIVGSAAPSLRNVFLSGAGNGLSAGLRVTSSLGNRVIGNYFGVRRDGTGAVGDGAPGTCSIYARFGSGNQFGGAADGERNLFGATNVALILQSEDDDLVKGNYFGLGPDGDTAIPIGGYGIEIGWGAKNNQIGGPTAEEANVFAGAGSATAIECLHAGTEGNRIQGNLIGSNASGTDFRPVGVGVMVTSDAGAQTIGGASAALGNYIATSSGTAITIQSGDGTSVRYNRCGLRKDGTAQPGNIGIEFRWTMGYARDNIIARATTGLYADGLGADARAYDNTFRYCYKAVRVEYDGVCSLGNLGNSSTTDDGGNVFKSTNTWHVYNTTANAIKAEGNFFDTTSKADIEAKVWDRLDDPAVGRVDFIPLAGGVVPTAEPLTLSSAAAAATGMGAEVVFSLSADASLTVEIMNVAGRRVAAPVQARPAEAGLQRVIWTRQTLAGTKAPAGVYLARISAATTSGETARALCRVMLR